jgi:hypothetical protein
LCSCRRNGAGGLETERSCLVCREMERGGGERLTALIEEGGGPLDLAELHGRNGVICMGFVNGFC